VVAGDHQFEGRREFEEIWLGLLNAFRTICFAPAPEIRSAFEQLGVARGSRKLKMS
jgi:hypothetical protein